MGDKLAAKKIAVACGVPVIPGSHRAPDETRRRRWSKAMEFGFPVILKAAAGGGGRGMRLCEKPEEVAPAFELVKSEARKAFGNDDIFIEKYLVEPKHIEVQILADQYGNVRPPGRARLLAAAPLPEGRGVRPGLERGRRRCASSCTPTR